MRASTALVLSGAVAAAVAAAACGRAGANDSPLLELGPEVLVSTDPEGGALRVEPSAAFEGRFAVVAWNDSWGGRHGSETGTAVAWAFSDDGARTFRFGGYIPATRAGEPPAGADSWLAADASGVFYLQVLSWGASRHELRILSMNPDESPTWREMAPGAVADASEGLDKPALMVSADGRLAVTYKRGKQVMLRRSPDGGRHWLPERPISGPDPPRTRQGPSVAGTGGLYVVCWYEQEGFAAGEELWCDRSNDGHEFGGPVRLFASMKALPPPVGYRISVGAFLPGANPWAAADRAAHRVWVAFPAGNLRGAADILLWHTERDDPSWRGPEVVGHGPPSTPKVFPAVAVAGGVPHVLYYDQRREPGSGWTDVYLSSRTAAGFRDTVLNSEPTDWTKMAPDAEHAPIQRNAGDYITLAADGDRLLAVWTDGRAGQPRIYARTVQVIR